MKLLPFAAIPAAALLLVGCASTAAAYETPRALLAAYQDAGGECSQPTEVPEAMVYEGADSTLCREGVTMLLVFDSEVNANGYVASVGGDRDMIRGERWVVVGDEVSGYADAMGGRQV